MSTHTTRNRLSRSKQAIEGRILPPLILWMLGVPGGIVLLLWLFFFRD
jgi:hypothetical protein